MKAFLQWIFERLHQLQADMKPCGSRVWQAICRTDKKLERAFGRMIYIVLILSVPVLLLSGAVLGLVIGTIISISLLIKSAFAHKQPSDREHR